MDELLNNTKKCTVCTLEKPLECFRKRSDRRDGLSSICKECYTTKNKNNSKTVVREKKCNSCLVTKPITNFYVHSWKSDGHFNQCKECYLLAKRSKIANLAILVTIPEFKECVTCKKIRSSEEFKKNKLAFDGLSIRCRCCEKEKRLKKDIEIKSQIKTPDKKVCRTCKIEKPSNYFYKNNSRKDGLRFECNVCTIKRKKRNFEKKTDEEKRLLKRKTADKATEYRKRSPIFKQYRKDYNIANRKKRSAYTIVYEKRKYHTDYNFKILYLLRRRLRSALQGNTKSKTTLALLGCSLEEFRSYFGLLFTADMSWEIYLNKDSEQKIAIDHIIPCSYFDLSNSEEQEMCFNYQNLQPLWAIENSKKWNRLDYANNIKVPWGDPNLSLEERKEALKKAIDSKKKIKDRIEHFQQFSHDPLDSLDTGNFKNNPIKTFSEAAC